ncbi:hypothetical protein JCM5350_007982 [Sporobolomyces pararoseus]
MRSARNGQLRHIWDEKLSINMPPKAFKTSPKASKKEPKPFDEFKHVFDKLPFTFEEAGREMDRCRKLVSAKVWQIDVEEALLEDEAVYGNTVDLNRPNLYLRFLQEMALADFFLCGLQVGRIFASIGRQLSQKHCEVTRFEYSWSRKLSEEDRKVLLVEAFECMAKMSGGISESSRHECPDLTVTKLSRNGGKAFIDLLRHIVQSGLTFPDGSDFFPVVSEVFDKHYGIDRQRLDLPVHRAIRAKQTGAQIDRHLFIGRFVTVVLAHVDIVPRNLVNLYPVVEKPRINRHDRNGPLRSRANYLEGSPQNAVVEELLRTYAGTGQDVSSAQAELEKDVSTFKRAQEVCQACERFADEIEGLSKFLCCKKCLDIGRSVPYCSVDRQKVDFKLGKHRSYCGKKFSDASLPFSGWGTPPSLPPPTLQWQAQVQLKRSQPPDVYPKRIYDIHYDTVEDAKKHGVPNCFSVQVPEFQKEVEVLFDQAVESREDRDVKRFLVELYFVWHKNVDWKTLAHDWDVDERKMLEWIKEGVAQASPQVRFKLFLGGMFIGWDRSS